MIFCCLNGGLFSIKNVLSSSWHFMSNATVTNVIPNNPCISCGACCAHFRVSFYWAESEAKGLAVELTEQINSFFSCMKGTNQAAPRCAALSGEIGEQVACSVYEQRPEACKEVQSGDEKCNIARLRHGLPPLNDLITTSPARIPLVADNDFDHVS